MNRKEQAAEMRSRWMVMREPKDLDGNRHTRRKRIAEARRNARAVSASAAEGAVSAGSQEPQADRASPSAADSEVA